MPKSLKPPSTTSGAVSSRSIAPSRKNHLRRFRPGPSSDFRSLGSDLCPCDLGAASSGEVLGTIDFLPRILLLGKRDDLLAAALSNLHAARTNICKNLYLPMKWLL